MRGKKKKRGKQHRGAKIGGNLLAKWEGRERSLDVNGEAVAVSKAGMDPRLMVSFRIIASMPLHFAASAYSPQVF